MLRSCYPVMSLMLRSRPPFLHANKYTDSTYCKEHRERIPGKGDRYGAHCRRYNSDHWPYSVGAPPVAAQRALSSLVECLLNRSHAALLPIH